jgi:hypothetical protein
MDSENFKAAAELFNPGSHARVAIARLDQHFGTRSVIAETPLLLPTHIQKAMAEHGYRSGAKGVFDTDSSTVYLIASNIDNAKDAVMAYRHEVTGHLGVRQSLGEKRDEVFRQIYASYESDARLEQIANTYRLNLQQPDSQLLAAEELIAHMAESGDRPTLYDSISLKAKEDYASVTGAAIEYSDNDIKVLLGRGREYLVSRTAFEPSVEPELRSPAELNPRWSMLNHLLARQPAVSTNAFDNWLSQSTNNDLTAIAAVFENEYLMLEHYSQFLVTQGIEVTGTGEMNISALNAHTKTIVGSRAVVITLPDPAMPEAAPGELSLRGFKTSIGNLVKAADGSVGVVDPLLTEAVWHEPASSLRFMYVGETGGDRLSRLDSFQRASEMKMENRPASEIWLSTGWCEGPDAIWRMEISDRDSVTSVDAEERIAAATDQLSSLGRLHRDGAITEAEMARMTAHYTQEISRIKASFYQAKPGTLPEFLSHPTLFEAYPELADVPVILDPDALYPEVTANTPRIIIPASYEGDPDLFRDTLIHETQHLVQRLEGFSRGLSPFMNSYREQWESDLNALLESDPDVQSYMSLQAGLSDDSLGASRNQANEDLETLSKNSPSVIQMNDLVQRLQLVSDPEAYTKAFGEIEAEDTVARMAMTEAQRRRIAPYSSTLPPDREVVLHQFDDIPQAMFMGPRSHQSNIGQLSAAHDLEIAGTPAELIFEQTGWFRGADTMWRFEVDDSKASVNVDAQSILEPAWETIESPRVASITYRQNPKSGYDVRLVPEGATRVQQIIDLESVSRSFLMMALPAQVASSIMQGHGTDDYYDLESDDPNGKQLKVDFVYDVSNALPLNRLLNHPTLFEHYPQLKDWSVAFHPEDPKFPNSTALCDTQKQMIFLFPSAKRQMIPVLLHEIQHGVQNLEGFAMGASPNDPSVAAKISGSQYHSEALRAVDLAPFKKGTAQQWAAFFNKQPGVKQAEIHWLGMDDFYSEHEGSIEASAIRDHIASQQLEIEESLSLPSTSRSTESLRKGIGAWMEEFSEMAASKGADRDDVFVELNELRSSIGWQLSTGQIPESARANEILARYEQNDDSGLSLKNFEAKIRAVVKLEGMAENTSDTTEYHDYVLDGGEDYRELLIKARSGNMPGNPGVAYQSTHWLEHENVMAHARFQSFRQDDGSRVLLVEEIQSDWRADTVNGGGLSDHYYQDYLAALDELSFSARGLNSTETKIAENQDRIREIGEIPNIKAMNEGDVDAADLLPEDLRLHEEYCSLVDETMSLVGKLDELHYRMSQAETNRSRALSMSETHLKEFPLGKDWFAMVAKRLVRYAAENGFDAISWSPASVQANRSRAGDRQRLDKLNWTRNPGDGQDLVHLSGSVLDASEDGDIRDNEVIRKILPARDLEKYLSPSVTKAILEQQDGVLEGPNLTFDARGFEQVYNQMLPKAMNKFLKEWGVKVQDAQLDAEGAAPKGTRFPTIKISDDMRRDLVGASTPMYMAQKASAMSAYFRSAGEVEARAVESTYRNPALKSVFPHERYDVPIEQQIVSHDLALALKLGANAMGADVTSMRHAAEIAADKALGVKEAADFVYLALTGTSQSPEADALRARCALLADEINPKLKESTGWTIGDVGHLRFDLRAPDCRAHKSVNEVIAEDVRRFAADVRNDRVAVTDITPTYNAITAQAVPLTTLIGQHPVLDAYPMLADVGVIQSPSRPETRWNAQLGQITVPPHLSRMELGAYLTKGLNAAVASMERLADPKIRHALNANANPSQEQRAQGLSRLIRQCADYPTIPNSMVAPAPSWLDQKDADVLAGMKMEDAQLVSQAAKMDIKGVWLSSVTSPDFLVAEAANEPSATSRLVQEPLLRSHAKGIAP